MTMQTGNDLFVRELAELHDAEQTMLELLAQEIRECGNEEQARSAFSGFERDTRKQVQNLERCLQTTGRPQGKAESYAIRGLKQQHETFMKEKPSTEVTVLFDLGEINKMTHYAIAAYAGLVEQAKLLDQPEVLRLLQENQSQEEAIGRQIQQLSQPLRKRWLQQPAGATAGRA